MKRYRCHKEVEAFRVTQIVKFTDLTTAAATEIGGELRGDGCSVTVSQAYLDKHDPRMLGYYVRYADGYESYSPREVFESGYTEIEG